MERQTQIGTGATAFFTLAGLVGAMTAHWVIIGPIMALCAGIAVWGFWPRKNKGAGGLAAASNDKGAFAGRDNTGIQQVFHGNPTIIQGGHGHSGGACGNVSLRAGGVGGSPSPQITTQLESWLPINRFTVAQAASLWAGQFPGMSFSFDKGKNPNIAAAEQLITTELRDKLDLTGAILAAIGDYSQAHVCRADLCELAKRHNAAPPFLTLGEGWN